jgi:hypothetical protein
MSLITLPGVDLFGTGRFSELKLAQDSQVGTGAALINLRVGPVPDGFIWCCVNADLRHDTAANNGIKLYMAIPDASAGLESLIQLAEQSVDNREHAAIAPRSFYLPSQCSLYGVSDANLAAAAVAQLNCLYAEIPVGEYVNLPG